jgi:hypothetical protein
VKPTWQNDDFAECPHGYIVLLSEIGHAFTQHVSQFSTAPSGSKGSMVNSDSYDPVNEVVVNKSQKPMGYKTIDHSHIVNSGQYC